MREKYRARELNKILLAVLLTVISGCTLNSVTDTSHVHSSMAEDEAVSILAEQGFDVADFREVRFIPGSNKQMIVGHAKMSPCSVLFHQKHQIWMLADMTCMQAGVQ